MGAGTHLGHKQGWAPEEGQLGGGRCLYLSALGQHTGTGASGFVEQMGLPLLLSRMLYAIHSPGKNIHSEHRVNRKNEKSLQILPLQDLGEPFSDICAPKYICTCTYVKYEDKAAR